jgi:hypothetical protein
LGERASQRRFWGRCGVVRWNKWLDGSEGCERYSEISCHAKLDVNCRTCAGSCLASSMVHVRHEMQEHVIVQTGWSCVVVPAAMDSSEVAFTVVVAVMLLGAMTLCSILSCRLLIHTVHSLNSLTSGHMVMLARRCGAASASWHDVSSLACPRTPLRRGAACR